MEKSKEKCPQCGKKLKFLKKHIKRAHSSGDIPGKILGKEIPKEQPSPFLKEINLQGEFTKMEEIVNVKKPEESKGESKNYKCGSCGGTFQEKIKRCPHCGVEFE